MAGLTNPALLGNHSAANAGLGNARNHASANAGLGGAGQRAPDSRGPGGAAPPLRPPDPDHYARQYARVMAGRPPPSAIAPAALARIASLGRGPPAALRAESLGLQQVFRDAMRYLGPYDPPRLEAAESGMSATLAGMRVADLCRGNGYGGGGPPSADAAVSYGGGGGGRRAFGAPHNNAMPTASNAGAAPVPTFMTGAALNDHVKMTSAPQQGVSCASLDDLCRAAGLYLSPEQKSLLPQQLGGGALGGGSGADSRGVANAAVRQPAAAEVLSNKVIMIQGLMDATGQQWQGAMQSPALAPRNGWASTEWENVKKASNNAASGLKLGKNDQSLVDDSDEEGDAEAAKPAAAPTHFKRRVRHSDLDKKRPAKRQSTTSSTSHHSQETPRAAPAAAQRHGSHGTPRAGVALHSGVSFSRNIRALPITETTLDRGHSFAMSEISLDRGQSMSAGIGLEGPGDDGQFSDASEDEGAHSPTRGGRLKRGLTIGTNHTFASSLGR